ncbi:MAG TPA: protein YgfX [Usitatibacter sp.]|nr:protein YgfX [Usitatibacter sp.]
MDSVTCDLKYSGAGLAFLLAAAAATVGLLVATPMPWAVRAWALLFVLATAARGCRQLLDAAEVRLDSTGAIEVRDSAGRWRCGAVRAGSFVMPWLTIVRWRPHAGRVDRTLVLLPGMAPAAALRKIRVILLWA